MTVRISDLVFYGAANMPETDTGTVGGTVDFTKRVSFSDIAPAGTMDYVSSSASDTAITVTLTYYDGSASKFTETKTLNGTTLVNGAATMERILKGVVTGTAVGDVAAISHVPIVTGTAQSAAAASTSWPARIRLAAGQGASVKVGQILRFTNNTPTGVQTELRRIIGIATGVDPQARADEVFVNADWSAIPSASTTYSVHEGFLFESGPNQVKEIRRPFYEAVANNGGGATKTFYEKIFVVNNNTSDDLTGATVTLFGETPALTGSSTLDMALCTALGDTASASDRLTLPANADTSALTFTSGSPPQTQAVTGVPAPGTLMTPTLVSVGPYGTFQNTSSVTLTYPASPVAGNYAIFFFVTMHNGGVDAAAVPAGWTLISHGIVGSLSTVGAMVKKLNGTESGTVTWNLTGSTNANNWGSGWIEYWSGLPDSGTVFEAVSLHGSGAFSTTMAGSSCTTTGSNEAVVTFYGGQNLGTGTITSSTPSGWTNVTAGSQSSPYALVTYTDVKVQAAAGTVTAPSRTLSASCWTAAITFALKGGLATSPTGKLKGGAAPNYAGAQGIWLKLTLPGGTDPMKTTLTMRLMGSTR